MQYRPSQCSIGRAKDRRAEPSRVIHTTKLQSNLLPRARAVLNLISSLGVLLRIEIRFGVFAFWGGRLVWDGPDTAHLTRRLTAILGVISRREATEIALVAEG